MKYSKFIQSVRDLGYRVDDIGKILYVTTTTGQALIAINKAKAYSVDSTYERFDSMLPDDDKKALLALTYELAITPLDEREDEEKYRLRLPFVLESRSYLNVCDDGSYFISGKYGSVGSKTVFSESEIVTLKEKYNLDGFIMEGVLEDD